MQAAETLQEFYEDISIPENLKSDRAPELCRREPSYLKLAKGKRTHLTYEDPERSNEIFYVNIAIRELKKSWHQKMVSKNYPRRVLDFGLKHSAKVIQMIPS